MKITVKRSSGFAGIQMPAKVLDTEDPLLMEEARMIVSKDWPAGTSNPDGMEYEISVEENDLTSVRKIADSDDTLLQSILKAVL